MKKVTGVELHHYNAPIHIREKTVLGKAEIKEALYSLKKELDEVFIVATCNRVGIYSYAENEQPAIDFFQRFGDLKPYLSVLDYEYFVADHLFSTAAGLNSQAVGEHQVLGQVREAYEIAKETGSMGPVLHELVKRAIRAGKRVKGETAIGKALVSISSVAFNLINKQVEDLSRSSMLMIGTGEMSTLMLKFLAKKQPARLIIASRDQVRAREMASIYQSQAITYDEIPEHLANVDVIVGATNSANNVLSAGALKQSINGKPKTLIDLGLPRNFDTKIKDLGKVKLYDLDQLKSITQKSKEQREKEIPHAKKIIREEVDDYNDWVKTNRINPLLSRYWQELEGLKEQEIGWAMPKLDGLPEQQKKVVEKMAHRLIRKISKNPMLTLKAYAREPDKKGMEIETFKEIFDMKDIKVNIPKKRILVGSRGSKLAMAQTNLVLNRLRELNPGYEFVIKPVKTSGDHGKVQEIGAFVKEVELALLNNEVDFCVHSYKDLPTKLPEGLVIGGIPERGDIRDVFISRNGLKLKEMPKGSVIGTSSIRRMIQIRELNPEVSVKAIHGNIITRMSKVDSGEVDGIVIAATGLQRIDSFHRATEIFTPEEFMPAVAQGVLAVETRENDPAIRNLIKQVDHDPTKVTVKAERAVLKALGGGCRLPLGAYANVEDNEIEIRGMFANEDNSGINRHFVKGPVEDAEKLGKQLAANLASF